jgi:hypothetical protein
MVLRLAASQRPHVGMAKCSGKADNLLTTTMSSWLLLTQITMTKLFECFYNRTVQRRQSNLQLIGKYLQNEW